MINGKTMRVVLSNSTKVLIDFDKITRYRFKMVIQTNMHIATVAKLLRRLDILDMSYSDWRENFTFS